MADFGDLLEVTNHADEYVQDLYCGEGEGWVEDYGIHYGVNANIIVKVSETRAVVSWIQTKTEAFGLFASDGSWPIPDYDGLRTGVMFALIDTSGTSPVMKDRITVQFPEPLSPVWLNYDGNGFVGPDGDVYTYHCEFIGYTIYPVSYPGEYWTEGPLTSSLDDGYPIEDPAETVDGGRRDCQVNIFSRIGVNGDSLTHKWTSFNGDVVQPTSGSPDKYDTGYQNAGTGKIFWNEGNNCVGWLGGQVNVLIDPDDGHYIDWEYGFWGSNWSRYYSGLPPIFFEDGVFFTTTSDSHGTGYIYGVCDENGIDYSSPVANSFSLSGSTYVILDWGRWTYSKSGNTVWFAVGPNAYTRTGYGEFSFSAAGVPTLVSVTPWAYQSGTQKMTTYSGHHVLKVPDGLATAYNSESTDSEQTLGGLTVHTSSDDEYNYMDWTPVAYSPTTDESIARGSWAITPWSGGVYESDDSDSNAVVMNGKILYAFSMYWGAAGDDSGDYYPDNRLQSASIWCALVSFGVAEPPPLKMSYRDDDKRAGARRLSYDSENSGDIRLGRVAW